MVGWDSPQWGASQRRASIGHPPCKQPRAWQNAPVWRRDGRDRGQVTLMYSCKLRMNHGNRCKTAFSNSTMLSTASAKLWNMWNIQDHPIYPVCLQIIFHWWLSPGTGACQAFPVNLAGPVSPVWCSLPQPSEPNEPSSCSVDFIGKWFLREVRLSLGWCQECRILGISMNQPYYRNFKNILEHISIHVSLLPYYAVLLCTFTHRYVHIYLYIYI